MVINKHNSGSGKSTLVGLLGKFLESECVFNVVYNNYLVNINSQ